MMDRQLYAEARFSNPERFSDDLAYTAEKARLLAWTYEQFTTFHFSLSSANEFAPELAELFMRVIVADLDKAAAAAEASRKAAE